MSSRSSVTAQKMIAVGLAKSESSLLIKHNKDSELKLLNSDQLRAKLSKNVRKMNWLAEQNDLIVATLKQRGLQAVEPDNNDVAIHPCVMQLDKLGEALFRTQFEPKRREEIALTAEELKAGGWWCADVSEECANAFKSKHLRVFNSSEWGDGSGWGRCSLDSDGDVTRGHVDSRSSMFKQINRIGNNFYWGAASDQAN